MSLAGREAGSGRGWRGRRLTTVTAAVTAPVVLAALALGERGFPIAQLDLNDGGVWLTATSQLALGRYNVPVEELDGGLVAQSATFDVLQDGADIVLVEPGRLSQVDPASVSVSQSAKVDGVDVSLAGGTLGIVDAQGHVWALELSDLASFDQSATPDLDLGPGAHAVTASDGSVLGVGSDGTVQRVVPGQEPKDEGRLGDGSGTLDQLTAVGVEPVALSGSTVLTRHGSDTLPGSGLVLQQPGPAATSVLVASTQALYEVPLERGGVRTYPTTGTGTAAAPVRAGSCRYGAWSSDVGSSLRVCNGQEQLLDLQGVTSTDTLVYRVNRGLVVLNDTAQGRVWLPDQDAQERRPNWAAVTAQDDGDDTDESSDGTHVSPELSAQCSKDSAAPSANDDDLGVRPGRATVLNVLDNDSSSDCGILAVSAFDPIPEQFGVLESVRGGRALQVTVAPGASGSVETTYTVSDGRGTQAPSTATLRLTARGSGEEAEPVQVRVSTVRVEAGGSVEVPVLADFADPDGDELVVTSATLREPQFGEVSARSDGTGLVTIRAGGGQLGRTQVDLTVSDGTFTVPGTVQVDVVSAGSTPPRIDPIHEVAYIGQVVILDAVGAVRSSGTDPPRLAGVAEVIGATVTPDLAGGTFTFSAARAGTYFVPFTIASGSVQGTGLARVDVLERPATPQPPVAVVDRAFLPAGGSVTIDPLANDEDPAGQVLVLREVRASDDSGLDVATLDNHLVQISSERTLTQPAVLTYVVSNGVAEDEGQIVVAPRPLGAVNQPPVVPDVEVSVRAGGVVTASVLDEAYDPDGDAISLVTTLPEALPASDGLLFVSGDVLRYQAPERATTVTTSFSVTDSAQQVTSARLTVHVHDSDAQTKSPPRPLEVQARVFAGESQRVSIPLTGIDDDGDGITLLGVGDSAPTQGRITAVGPDWLEYEAYPDALGGDTFTYAVEDWTGQRAVGTVRIGIAVRPSGAATVLARPDSVSVRPGMLVEVPVLANDVDATGAELSLDPVLEVPDGVEASVDGDRVVVRAPGGEQTVSIVYTATNARGGRDSAVLTLAVAEQAVVANPIASDVVVPAVDTLGRTEVSVSVLAVAANPSGPLSDLAVSVPAQWADVAQVGADGSVLVQLADHVQTLPYLLTNTTQPSASAYAFITVPALGFFPPTNRPRAPELRVASGAQLTISLSEQVQVAPGRTATVADATKVTATRSDGSNLVASADTLTFRSVAGYAGPASISVPVTDSLGAGDTQARTATIQLSITVYAVDDHPPTFKPFVLEVGPGDAELAVDLLAFTLDPAGQRPSADEYTFRQDSTTPTGFTVRVEGTVMRVAADVTTPKGTTGRVALVLGYGQTGTLLVNVDLRVRASTLPTARVLNRQVDGVEGQNVVVDVLADAYNPFPDSPLTVRTAWVDTPGAGTVSTGTGSVTVTPARGFVGLMAVRVAVRDVTGDADREVEATVTVRVRGVPSAPGTPRIDQVGNRSVALSWTASDARGEPVLEYLVTANPGAITQSCTSTVCTLSTLTNNLDYTFTVAARNAVGWSDPSPASASARPDAVPDAPATPTATAGDGQLVLSWTAPTSTGSPITGYTVEISPAPASGPATLSATTTSLTVTGLVNGTAYTARVRAANSSPDPGPWSSWSAPTAPIGLPGPPQALTAARVDSPLGGQIVLTWQPGALNGAPINGYELVISGGAGAGTVSLPGSATGYTLAGADNGAVYTFGVRARNDAGWSTAATATASTFGVPQVPPGVAATGSTNAEPDAASLTVTWSTADGNGSPVTSYEVRVSGGTPTSTGPAVRSLTLSAVAGVAVPVDVRACNAAGCGDFSAQVVVTPTTKPGPVTNLVPVLEWQDGVLMLSATWQAPSTWGNADGQTRQYRVSMQVGPGQPTSQTVSTAGFDPTSIGAPQEGTVVVVRVRAETGVGDSAVVEAQVTVPAPQTTAPATGGGAGAPGNDGP